MDTGVGEEGSARVVEWGWRRVGEVEPVGEVGRERQEGVRDGVAGDGVEGVGQVHLEHEVGGVGGGRDVADLVKGEGRCVADADSDLERVEGRADVLDVGEHEGFGHEAAESVGDGDWTDAVGFFGDGD